jgi:uncharacterized protein YwqG
VTSNEQRVKANRFNAKAQKRKEASMQVNNKRDRENLRKLIREMGFEAIEDYLLQHARPSIRVCTERVEDENSIPLGRSKIGGRPDLPKNIEWVSVTHGDKRFSLLFIAQFNLAEIKPYDEENLLPASGILYFFADSIWNGFITNEARVIYFDGDLSLLERKTFPEDIPPTLPQEWGERFDACAVTFVPEVNLPGHDANWVEPDIPEGKTWGELSELEQFSSYAFPNHHTYGFIVNRLLGYNYGVPEDMQLDCQLILETGRPYNATPEQRQSAEQHKGDWQLLFQMDSDENAGMMWSDAGVICFYIRRQDLINKNFDHVCLAHFSG